MKSKMQVYLFNESILHSVILVQKRNRIESSDLGGKTYAIPLYN